MRDVERVYLDDSRTEALDWLVLLDDGNTAPPVIVDRFGNKNGTRLYRSDGTRRYMVDELGNRVTIYSEGRAIPLYDWWGRKVTRDEREPDGGLAPGAPEPEPNPEPGDTTEPEPGDQDGDDDPSTPTEPGEDTAPGTVDEGTGLVPVSELLEFMQGDPVAPEVARIAIEGAGAMVAAYCRGRHVDRLGNPRPGVSAVVITAAARIAANPGQVSRTDRAGNFTRIRGEGFSGFTLAEQQVLNRYRKRAR